MARSKSSNNWLDEHHDDYYVKQSKSDGYRSRAAYKLLEIHEKDQLLKPGLRVIDLGAAPGGWSQVVSRVIGEKGTVIASDILPMDTIANVEFVQGDFTEELVLEEILTKVENNQFDLVISDMAPNMSGMNAIDQPKAMYLVELALDLAMQVLKPNGVFLTKVFQGEGFDDFLSEVRGNFTKVVTRKPGSSRARSREVFLLAKGFKPTSK